MADAPAAILHVAGQAAKAARSWAVVLRRVFEIDPLLCETCGVPNFSRKHERRMPTTRTGKAPLPREAPPQVGPE